MSSNKIDYELQEYITDSSVAFHAVRNDISLGVIDASSVPSMDFFEMDIYGDVWYFNRLYVRPDYRNNGIATVLMKRFVDFIRERDLYMVCDINAYGDLDSDQLCTFYQRFGFRKIFLSFHGIRYSTLILKFDEKKDNSNT